MVHLKQVFFWGNAAQTHCPHIIGNSLQTNFVPVEFIYAGKFPEPLEKRKNRKNRLQFQKRKQFFCRFETKGS
jgi:hypothetical protein